MSLILLRHTKPAIAPGTCYGRTDLGLADCFEVTARAAIDDLPRFTRLATSPLSRCRRLAERVAMARGVDLATDPRLIEMDFGRWEGVPWTAIPRAELDAWAADFEGARPHGGESPALLAERVGAALDDLGDEPTLWVTHSGVVRAVCAIRQIRDGWETQLDFGGWMHLEP